MVRQVAPIGQLHKKHRQRELGTTRMLITALDYIGSGHDLTCTVDGKNMEALARASGVTDITVAVNEQCTVPNIRHMIQTISARCQPYDTFIFNYSGHGTSVTDTDGDEADNQDEAFVFVDEYGKINMDTSLMVDDEFSELLLQVMPPTVTIICIADCCHSGSIMDFNRPGWRGRKAISISGCRDTQTSGDTGKGGICTHSLLMAIENLQQKGQQQYTVGKLFAETLKKDDEVFASPQDITLDKTRLASQSDIVWPLIPKTRYQAPYHTNNTSSTVAPHSTYTTTGPAQSSAYTTTTGQVTSIAAPTTQYLGQSASSFVLPNPGTGGSAYAPATYVVTSGGSSSAPAFAPSPYSGITHGSPVVPGTSYVMPSSGGSQVSIQGSQVVQGTSYVMPSGGSPYTVTPMQPVQPTPAPMQPYVVQAHGYPVHQGNHAISYAYPAAASSASAVMTPYPYVSSVPTYNNICAVGSPIFSPRGVVTTQNN